ncbi:MAG: SRPBCC domain-containing protein [bacterium]
MADLTTTVSRTIKASPQRVFDAWLDPEIMTKFMVPRDKMHARDVKADPRVGGRFQVIMVGDKEYPHEGTYLEITPHSRLVFTWEAPWSAPGTTVTIELTPETGGTRVDLTQVRFMSEEARDSHAEGWTGMLANLATLVEV